MIGTINISLLRSVTTESIYRTAVQRMTRPSSSFPGSQPTTFVLLLFMCMLASSACLKRSRVAISSNKPNEQADQTAQPGANDQQPSLQRTNQLININTASANELETLPGIGKGLAQRIIDHRERFGPFRRAEHLIIVRGISDKRFRALRDLITAN